MGCGIGSFLLRLAPSPLVSWKGYENLLMGCDSFCWFRSGRLAYWEPNVGRCLWGYVDLSADNAEPLFKNLLTDRKGQWQSSGHPHQTRPGANVESFLGPSSLLEPLPEILSNSRCRSFHSRIASSRS